MYSTINANRSLSIPYIPHQNEFTFAPVRSWSTVNLTENPGADNEPPLHVKPFVIENLKIAHDAITRYRKLIDIGNQVNTLERDQGEAWARAVMRYTEEGFNYPNMTAYANSVVRHASAVCDDITRVVHTGLQTRRNNCPFGIAGDPITGHAVPVLGDIRDPFFGTSNSVALDCWVNIPMAHTLENGRFTPIEFQHIHMPGGPSTPFFPEVVAQQKIPTAAVNQWLQKNGYPRIGPELVLRAYELHETGERKLFDEMFSVKNPARSYYSSADNILHRFNTVPADLYKREQMTLEKRAATARNDNRINSGTTAQE